MEKAAETIVKDCMDLKENESVLIITDSETRLIGDVLLEAAKKITSKVNYIEIPVGKVHGQEPPEETAELMLNYDVILIATEKSLSHTKARREANARGARIASMPMITEDILNRTIDINYDELKETHDKLREKLMNSNKIRITTESGTDITTSLTVTHGLHAGKLHNKGDYGNLPTGEVDSGVKAEETNGIIIVDASFSELGKLETPITLEVKEGNVISIEGNSEAEKLKEILNKVGEKAYKIAEFGIGTNPRATITGNLLEDEKVLGTVHFALGNDIRYNGRNDVPIHLDGTVTKATVYVDDEKIMEKGLLLI
jgi:leucyl aminopeptidase (aminopeptidase T)